jgi:presenilin-like A22 family membrane protease
MREALILLIFFVITLLFSIYLGTLTKKSIEKGEIEPIFKDPKDYRNSIYLLLLVLAGTILLLFFMKTKFEMIRLMENMALFFLISTTFSYFLPTILSIVISISLVILSEVKRSQIIKNICLFLSVSSASALVGSSLDYKVTLLFFLLLSFYDFISVFITKHMVFIAEKLLSRPTALISVFPYKKERRVIFTRGKKKIKIIALGAGDYFVPAALCVSLLELGIKFSLLCAGFNTIMLFIIFYLINIREVVRPLPAIPFLFLSSILSLATGFLLFR